MTTETVTSDAMALDTVALGTVALGTVATRTAIDRPSAPSAAAAVASPRPWARPGAGSAFAYPACRDGVKRLVTIDAAGWPLGREDRSTG